MALTIRTRPKGISQIESDDDWREIKGDHIINIDDIDYACNNAIALCK